MASRAAFRLVAFHLVACPVAPASLGVAGLQPQGRAVAGPLAVLACPAVLLDLVASQEEGLLA